MESITVRCFCHANGNGTQYYDSDMNSVHVWDKTNESTIYAHWSKVAEQKYSSLSKTGAAVYVDLVSFEPCVTVSKTMINGEREIIPSYLVCKCKTTNGATVYIYLLLQEYQREIDPNADYVNLKLGRFETTLWTVAYGWYTWGGNRPVCGWYLIDESNPADLKPYLSSHCLVPN